MGMGGDIGFTLSVCPSVSLSVCGQNRVCSLFPQYSPGTFYIYTSYLATTEGVSRVNFVSKFQNSKFLHIL